jgi:hypothetical protein
MKFQVFREMSEVVSLHVFVDHDCHTDVATFTATKGHFVQGKSGNYFVRETFVKILNYLLNRECLSLIGVATNLPSFKLQQYIFLYISI